MIAEVLEYYGAQLPRDYGQVNLRCCFHDDHLQSATANLDEDVFYCFTCGTGGNAYQIVMAQEGISNADAVNFIKDTIGVSGEGVRRVADSTGYGVARRPGNRPGRRRKVPAWRRRDAGAGT